MDRGPRTAPRRFNAVPWCSVPRRDPSKGADAVREALGALVDGIVERLNTSAKTTNIHGVKDPTLKIWDRPEDPEFGSSSETDHEDLTGQPPKITHVTSSHNGLKTCSTVSGALRSRCARQHAPILHQSKGPRHSRGPPPSSPPARWGGPTPAVHAPSGPSKQSICRASCLPIENQKPAQVQIDSISLEQLALTTRIPVSLRTSVPAASSPSCPLHPGTSWEA